MIPAGHGPGSLLSEAKRQADGDRLGQIFSTFFEYGRVQAQVHFLFHRVAYLFTSRNRIQGKQPFCRFWRKDGASSESNARRADACQTLLLGSLGGSRVQAAAYRVLKCSTYRKI